MRFPFRFSWFLLLTLIWSPTATAQSLEDLELRQKRKNIELGFGFLGLFETATGLNRDRPELSNLLFLAPQLKIGRPMRVRVNVGLVRNWLDRQTNPWDMTDVSLQFSHLNIYTEKWSGIRFSGYGRWYFPTSKASRNADNLGQLRLVGTATRTIGPVTLSLQVNAQKYFFRHTTWSTDESAGSQTWFSSAGREDYIENNASYGLGESLTGTYSTPIGLDLSASYGLYQTRPYAPDEGHDNTSGSSLVDQPRDTVWSHSFRLVLDATYGLGHLPWVDAQSASGKLLSKTYLSLGYSNFAPQLPADSRGRNLNPFRAKYGSAYFDILVLY